MFGGVSLLLNKETYLEYTQYTEKVLQFGSGNFLRGFADWIIDKMNKETNFNGSIVIVQSTGSNSNKSLNDQDGLFTLYLKEEREGKEYSEHRVINSISRTISTFNEYEEYLKIAENPEMRFIISNTTEAGIAFAPDDKLNSLPQQSFPGKLTAFLYKRYKYFKGALDKGFIIIPCELIHRNGDMLKEIVLKYAKLWELEEKFIKWIGEANTFCCSLVDRVVSGFPKRDAEGIFTQLGYVDKFIVEAEFFHQWVIEGPQWIKEEFPCNIEGLNVQIVEDVNSYRTRKVRLLNGVHTALMPVGYLYGLYTVRASVEDDVIGKYMKETIFKEIIPTLSESKDELEHFAASLIKRFKNPAIDHELMSISLNSMSKFQARVLPTIAEYYEIYKELPKNLVFSLAALIKFYSGVRNGEEIKLRDASDILDLYKINWECYERKEIDLRSIVINVLAYEKLWESNLNNIPGLTQAVSEYLHKIKELGMAEAIKLVI
jgi:tagaturonate reductase